MSDDTITPPVATASRGKQAAGGASNAVYLVDPHLRDGFGHYLDYALAIYHEAHRRGDRFLAFVALDATDAVRGQLPVKLTFRRLHDSTPSRYRLRHAFRVGTNLVKHSIAIFVAVRRATRGTPPGRATFFFPNASTFDVVGYALWVLTQPRRQDVSYVVLLRYDHHVRGRHPQVLAAWLKLAFWLLKRRHGMGVVRLASDSAPLAHLYGELSDEPIEVLPIPHVVPEADSPRARNESGRSTRTCHFVYLGGWRSEQGVEDLTDALGLLRSEFASCRFTATVQANPRPIDLESRATGARLKASNLPGIELIEEVLDRERFLECLAAADVVLAPYSSDAYRYRTSGIFAEAVALGKPVITSRGSWMSSEVDGENTLLFESGRPEELARVMRAAAADLCALRERAARRQVSWIAFHNPKSFYDRLVGRFDEHGVHGADRSCLP